VIIGLMYSSILYALVGGPTGTGGYATFALVFILHSLVSTIWVRARVVASLWREVWHLVDPNSCCDRELL
jgi:hypothetical protein